MKHQTSLSREQLETLDKERLITLILEMNQQTVRLQSLEKIMKGVAKLGVLLVILFIITTAVVYIIFLDNGFDTNTEAEQNAIYYIVALSDCDDVEAKNYIAADSPLYGKILSELEIMCPKSNSNPFSFENIDCEQMDNKVTCNYIVVLDSAKRQRKQIFAIKNTKIYEVLYMEESP